MDERDFLFGKDEAKLDERREVKVRIPVAYLIKLHGIKLLNGQGISETVTEALALYFEAVSESGIEEVQNREPDAEAAAEVA